MNEFQLQSTYKPTGDQPEAIKQLVEGINRGDRSQVLLGVTGSGKTFTVANVIQQTQKPTLVLSHNKTLAAQLYSEFKQFFPNNKVEYFVSYYDYYQPEAYLPTTDTYIEKDLSINEEIEKLRLSTTSSLLSGRTDVIVVSSVSCIYGMGNPADFKENIIKVRVGERISRNKLLFSFVSSLYSRTEADFKPGNFRVKGETVDVFPAYADFAFRIIFFDNEIDQIYSFNPQNGNRIDKLEHITLFPANIFVTTKEKTRNAIVEIQDDLVKQINFFKESSRFLEAKRVEERTNFDLEMIRELGYCSGIENYSRYFDGRLPGTRPFCLLDYFPSNFLLVIDESHVTIPQIRGMFGGDRSRKENLVEFGFRLPAAMDNRPLKFDEFYSLINQVIYVSATPAEFEMQEAEGVVVEQVIRPTGLLDPIIEVRPVENQIDDLLDEIHKVTARDERVLVTTLTKRMAEELTEFLAKKRIRCKYIHSDVDTLDRVEILRELRIGLFDVLIGVNLLREGLDLPEVSLVAILDADKEGFLRSERSLVQTVGRAARNVNGLVIMYADSITESMQKTIDETQRRRLRQIAYNYENNITPTQIRKSTEAILSQTKVVGKNTDDQKYYIPHESIPSTIAAEEQKETYLDQSQIEKSIKNMQKKMQQAAKALDFMEAARLRDEMFKLQKLLNKE